MTKPLYIRGFVFSMDKYLLLDDELQAVQLSSIDTDTLIQKRQSLTSREVQLDSIISNF